MSDKKVVIIVAIIGGIFLVVGALIEGFSTLAGSVIGPIFESWRQPAANATEQAVTKTTLPYEHTFDGSFGWNLKEGVRIENGNLLIYPGRDAVPDSNITYADFIFESRFYIPASGGMAFYLRNQLPQCPDGSWTCSIKITLDFKRSAQIFTADRSLGSTPSINIARNSLEVLRLNDWNEIRVTVQGSGYEVHINDSLVFKFVDSTYISGSFIIDNDPDSSSEIKLDYIRIYEIQ